MCNGYLPVANETYTITLSRAEALDILTSLLDSKLDCEKAKNRSGKDAAPVDGQIADLEAIINRFAALVHR